MAADSDLQTQYSSQGILDWYKKHMTVWKISLKINDKLMQNVTPFFKTVYIHGHVL